MNILITNADEIVNQKIADYYSGKGYNCILLFRNEKKKELYSSQNKKTISVFMDVIDEKEVGRIFTEIDAESIDVLIHGNEQIDEEQLFEKNPFELERLISEKLKDIFLINKVVISVMMKPKKGNIIFPLFYDPLYYAGYPSSPILNQAKLALCKCLSREVGPFKLNVNAMTFGYYDDAFDKEEKKNIKHQVEIFSLKPKLPAIEEYIPSLDIFIEAPTAFIGGENIHVGAGIETGI